MSPALDPRTPVLVGVGQFSERLDDAGYRALSPVGLGAEAARRALADTGASASVADRVDLVAGVRQFEMSLPGAVAPLGRSDNVPRSVARRVGTDPRRAVLEVVGGQSPQRLVSETAGLIAAGEVDAALLVGAEAMSTMRALLATDEAERPDWTEHVGGQLEDRGLGLDDLLVPAFVEHEAVAPVVQYALLEHARRARLTLSREAHRHAMGELFAPFSRVAAANPHSAAPTARSADELATASASNRPVTDPYLRHLVARDQVNQAAAVVLTSVGTARELGIPDERWVFLHGHADLSEPPLLDRADLDASPAAARAVTGALDQAGIGVDDLATLDLYSCFPVAVWAVTDPLGLDAADPRGLTLTGGLPFFGGPGNDYSMHAITETVAALRRRPGGYGLVGANGGVLHKYSAGVYSTTPAAWHGGDDAALQAHVDAVHRDAPGHVERADGPATVETFTVEYQRDGRPRSGLVVGRLGADGRRFLARTEPEVLDLLVSEDPLGAPVAVRSTDAGNRVGRP